MREWRTAFGTEGQRKKPVDMPTEPRMITPPRKKARGRLGGIY